MVRVGDDEGEAQIEQNHFVAISHLPARAYIFELFLILYFEMSLTGVKLF